MRTLALSLTAIALGACFSTAAENQPSAERGAKAVHSLLNPPDVSLRAYENLWKQWGAKERPAEFDQAVRERYGLHVAPYDNNGMPMGVQVSKERKGISFDCLLCHAGTVAGQTVIGVGNSSLDIAGLFKELQAGEFFRPSLPFQLSNVRGTIEATAVVNFFMEFRNADLTLRLPKKFKVADEACEDVPAWWLMKRKQTMYHTGGGHARSVRTMMAFLLPPQNSADAIKKLEPTFADIQAYLLSLEAPKYPFEINKSLAAEGHKVYTQNCAKCHGTYGANATYPNKVVPLETVSTDPKLAHATSLGQAEHFLKSWFMQEPGITFKPQTVHGYQAPPLDGVWATAPYFHNASAPTVYHVLNSKARPKIFTRSYRSEREDYDVEKLGLKITELKEATDENMSSVERRKIYDTTQPGRSNKGHTFGDHLSDDQRRAVIEYLKTI